MRNDANRRQFAAGAVGAVVFAMFGGNSAQAEAVDPAARRIESYYASLLPVVNAAR